MNPRTKGQGSPEWISERQLLRRLGIGPTRWRRIRDEVPVRQLRLPSCPPMFHAGDTERLIEAATYQPAAVGTP